MLGRIRFIRQLCHHPTPVVISGEGIRSGDIVEIIRGPFAQQRGHVLSADKATQVQIRIPSLGCFANLEIPVGDIRKLTPQ